MTSTNTNTPLKSSKLTRSSLAHEVYAALRQSLAIGELKPNHRLNGRILGEQLGVSQTPVREAMLQLVAERALTLNRNRSVTVPVLSTEQFIELRDIRVALETLAVRYVVDNIKDSDLPPLENIHKKLLTARKQRDFKTTMRLNREFHFTTYQFSNRPELIAMIEGLWVRTGPYIAFLYQYESKAVEHHAHDRLIDALRKRDPDAAAAAIADDIITGGAPILEGILAMDT